MSKSIPLTKGKVAIVDDEDFAELSSYKWCYFENKNRKTGYAIRTDVSGPKRKTIWMHRVITGAANGVKTDHRDGNGLNNTRINLRDATDRQNAMNRGRRTDNTVGVKGVGMFKGKFRARISLANGKRKLLGCFSTLADAANAYAMASKEHHGEFSRI